MTKHHILAIDPGKATGIAFFEWEDGGQNDPVLLHSWEVTIETYAPIIRWALENYPGVHVVCEKFTITIETAKKSPSPYSLEHIGMLRLCLMDVGRDPYGFAMQTPTDAKRMFPNPKLKRMGYWHKGGEGHALDAIRHGMLYIVKLGWASKLLLD